MQRNYKEYFHAGQRARVEMSLKDGGTFSEGGVVSAVSGNRITLCLARETLPEGVLLDPQAPLLIRVGGRGKGYSCRGVVLGPGEGDELQVGLIEEVVPEDLREYFRLKAELPVTLHNITAGTKECSFERPGLPGEGCLPRITNISGGGVRAETEMEMKSGDIVEVSFHLPHPEPKVVPIVAEVVQSEQREQGAGSCFSAGLRYQQIQEKDRDAVVRYVCSEEIKRIRLCRKQYFSFDS